LYEAYRQKKNAGHYDQLKLKEPQLGELLESWKLEMKSED
jgi:hypothetical protein